MTHLNNLALREALDRVEQGFDKNRQVENDPLSLVLAFDSKADQEVAALIASVFAYGNVKQIKTTLKKVFSLLGPNPAESLKTARGETWKKKIPKDFRHRFNNHEDLGVLFTWLGEALRQSDSLENFFLHSPFKSLEESLNSFVNRLTNLDCTPYKKPRSKGALFFFPKPQGKSACKRMALFLRWVAGSGPMTLSIWDSNLRAHLVMPVDTHILRISRHLGLTKRKDNSWKTALEITDKLNTLSPGDPTRYDFAICHLGISQACPSRFNFNICHSCQMNSLCITYEKVGKKLKSKTL